VRLEELRLETGRAESGGGILGRGSEFTNQRGPGESCELPQWDLGKAPTAKSLDAFCVFR